MQTTSMLYFSNQVAHLKEHLDLKGEILASTGATDFEAMFWGSRIGGRSSSIRCTQ